MSDIQTILQQILSARYGKDVRQNIHDGIETCYEDGKAGATDLIARAMISEVYDSTQTYSAGEYTIYDGALYKAIEEATGEWDADKWEEVTIGEEMADLKAHEVTQAEYDALPETKTSDGIAYYITDGAPNQYIMLDGTAYGKISAETMTAENITYDNTESGAESSNVQSALDEVFAMVLDKLYPVGSIYLETTNTNPSAKLGGTWEAYGASDTYLRLGGSGSGGSNTVTLNKNQIPSLTTGGQSDSHTHTIPQMRIITSDGTGYFNAGTGGSTTGYTVALSTNNTGKLQLVTAPNQNTGGVSGDHTHTYTNSSQKTVSITPKYVQVYAWKRTA